MKQLRIDGDYDMIQKSESRIQQEIVRWFRNNYCLNHNNPRHLIFSVPNERSNAKEQSRMIATGLLSGVSDLIVVLPSVVLFIEVKDSKGLQSTQQKQFEQSVENLGFKYYLVRSLEDFQKIISKYICSIK